MSQVTDVSIAANPSGLAMRAEINNVFAAFNSMNRGPSRPASVVACSMWVDDTADPIWTVYFYDGANDLEFFIVDSNAHTFTISPALTLDTNPGLEYNVSALRVKADEVFLSRSASGLILKPQAIGDVLGYTTAGAPYVIPAGTTRQALTIPTTGAAPAFAAHGGDFGHLLAAVDMSSTPATNQALTVGTGWGIVTFVGTGIEVATDGVNIDMRVSTNGTSFESAGYSYHIETKTDGSTSYSAAASTSAANVPIINNLGNATTEACNFVINFYHPSDATNYLEYDGHFTYRDAASGRMEGGTFFGGIDTATAVLLVGIVCSSGNIDGGTLATYGRVG